MKTHNKHLLIAGIIILVSGLAALGYWLWKDGIVSSMLKGRQPSSPSGDGGNAPSTVPTDLFPLRRGSIGSNVKALQRALNAAIAYFIPARPFVYRGKQRSAIAVDGVWKDETQAAVNWFYMIDKKQITEAELRRLQNIK